MKTSKIYNLLIIALLLGISGCTDLEIEETDSRFPNLSGEFTGVDATESLENLYNSVRGQVQTQEDMYGIIEVSSDEFLVPTRGTDWGDNGVWRSLHGHTWSTTHNLIKNTWNALNSNVYNATTIIDPLSEPTPQQAAEAKFIRAYSMFWLMDLFGQVPFRSPQDGPDVNPSVMTRTEAYEFAVKDLTEAISDLPSTGPGEGLIKASKASARYLLAKLYLNKHIYTGAESPNPADMTQVVELVDDIQADGFALQEGYFELFTNDTDTETIFFTTSDIGSRIWNGLHYNQGAPDNTGGGWNGFTTLAEFYDLFEGDPNINTPGSGQEERRGYVPLAGVPSDQPDGDDEDNLPDDDIDEDGIKDGSNIGFGFLIGQQYGPNGEKLKDRQGNDLVYSKELPGLLGNNERTGIRVLKYSPVNGSFATHMVLYRYADAHLMKAEAIMRGGSSGEDALTLVNELRTIRGATPLGSLTEQDLLDERGRELYGEYWRRNDQIRFGTFTDTWEFKDNTEEFRVLFPIPETAIITNPNLIQNEGY
ncbi:MULTISPECIES: RagB/SusD family nutrient uptake outer membrane protein [Galbibacter]|uniref:RagB/SusD family nutrient uptake outer membrane protein n=1 Tax=Galbibacter pacificus TaxID=2996052 RepID=A0ABT6FWT6_9FLAO|nr:RagB/SusD family nutrient uptake outer membrane protein [Galbibacter pacificus]MDG3583991.1 RagB/SusD family nutrient uptake outer membrane protein [Galbibacter pacificus]MDG3587572.1 RagB/SusD family nutrient uptake outer membrane protein [Galbibacter pacificus]